MEATSLGVIDREPVNRLVKRRPKVIYRFTQDDGPLSGDGFEKMDPQDILHAVRVVVWNESIRLLLVPPFDRFFQHYEVMLGAVDLEENGFNGCLGNPHRPTLPRSAVTEWHRADTADA